MSGFARKLLAAGVAVYAAAVLSQPERARAQTPASVASVQPADAAAAQVTPSAPGGPDSSANRGNPDPSKGPSARVALVIGNSSYANVTALPNPANDARAISQLLNAAKFEVIAATDLNREEMIKVVQDFAARIVERGPDTIALIYYAGHGLQVAGENYLVPIDARIEAEADIAGNTVRLVDVMATLDSVKSRTRVVILDACRNNPFARLGEAGKGLAIVDAPNGSIVAYSTAPGAEALDGVGQHSPYTNAFLKLARTPNVPIEQFFKRVRLLVNDVTDGRQTPWESSSLTSDFYLFTEGAAAQAVASDAVPVTRQPVVQVADLRRRSVRAAYDIVIEEDAIEYYEEFVQLHPTDPLAAQIRALLAMRLQMVAWHGAVKVNTPAAYQAFQQKFSGSPLAPLALKLQAKPKALPVTMASQVFKPARVLPNINLPVKPVNVAPPVKPLPAQPVSFKPVPLKDTNAKVLTLPATTAKTDPKVIKPVDARVRIDTKADAKIKVIAPNARGEGTPKVVKPVITTRRATPVFRAVSKPTRVVARPVIKRAAVSSLAIRRVR